MEKSEILLQCFIAVRDRVRDEQKEVEKDIRSLQKVVIFFTQRK